MAAKQWDIFISHASEDKATVARPLAAVLRRGGARVWLDEQELTVGDSLSEKIDEGLAQSRFGAVILSPAFLAKHWPKKELAGLRSREEDGQKVILPVWHNVDKTTIRQFSPILADVLAANTDQGIDSVARQLADILFPMVDRTAYPYVGPTDEEKSVGRRLIEILEFRRDKEALIEFLRFHLSRGDERFAWEWGGVPVIEEYQLHDVVFDAYASYVGHGMELTLVNFTEVWADPFEVDREGALKIHERISTAISAIESVRHRFGDDGQSRAAVRSWVGSQHPWWWGKVDLDAFLPEPDLRFFVYAGRRSQIDASQQRHDKWTELRGYSRDISIKTYDSLIDPFL
jgi:hypothetical protein